MKVKKMRLGITVLLAICLSATLAETIFRKVRPEFYPGGEYPGNGPLVLNGDLGWTSREPVKPLDNSSGGRLRVLFTGDSFTTQNRKWPRHAQSSVVKRGLRFNGYVGGVSGFGTTQSFLKLQKDFDKTRPDIVVHLFFAWNDLRDNYRYPGIWYSADIAARPYADFSPEGEFHSVPPYRPFLSGFALYWVTNFGLSKMLDAVSWDVNFFTENRIFFLFPYSSRISWLPFYMPSESSRPYVESAWEVTEKTFVAMNKWLKERHAKLLVVGIDNAFTVDNDVYEKWIGNSSEVNVTLPLPRLGRIMGKHDIPYINMLPLLQKLRSQVRGKIYDGPPGSIGGHLGPEAELLLGRVVAEKIVDMVAR